MQRKRQSKDTERQSQRSTYDLSIVAHFFTVPRSLSGDTYLILERCHGDLEKSFNVAKD